MMDKYLRTKWPMAGMICLVLCIATPVVYAKDKATSPQQRPANKKPARIKVDPEQEARVLEIATAHMPELSELLDRLRTDQPRGYAKAIRDLSRSTRKLQLAKERDEQLFELELDLWKKDNRVNLLVAQLKVRDNPKDRKQLKAAAEQQQQAQRARIEYEIDNLRRRIERAKSQLASAEKRLSSYNDDPEARAETTYQKLLSKAGRSVD